MSMKPTKPEDVFRAEKERSLTFRNSQHARLLAEAKAAFDKLMAEGQAARKSGRPRKHPLPPLKTTSSRTPVPPPRPPAPIAPPPKAAPVRAPAPATKPVAKAPAKPAAKSAAVHKKVAPPKKAAAQATSKHATKSKAKRSGHR